MSTKIDEESGWQQFLTLCRETQSETELNDLLSLLLTIDERIQIATRVLLIKELLVGKKAQRQIASELELSIAKITRGSNALKTIPSQLKNFLMSKLLKD